MTSSSVNIPWWHTAIGERERAYLLQAFDQRRFSMGPVSEQLQEALAAKMDVPHVVLTPSGTAALTMALMACDLEAGDEVIVPDLTWIATAQAATTLGAKVVLVDSGEDSPCLDVAAVARAITPRTKAILPVHFHGRTCDLASLRTLAEQHGVRLIEDACKAMFCRTSAGHLGTIGDIGCFSLGMISLISAGYGGFAVTHDPELHRRMRLIRDHGVARIPSDRYERNGFNFKISDLLCAIALGQLERLDEKLVHLADVHRRYVAGLSDLDWISVIPIETHAGEIPLCVDLLTPHRNALCAFLAERGIQTSAFHPPLHEAGYLDQGGARFDNAERYASEGFMPPCGPAQPLANVDRAIEAIRAFERFGSVGPKHMERLA